MHNKYNITGIIIFLVLISSLYLSSYSNSSESDCIDIKETEKDICFLKLAKQKNNQEHCKNIKDIILLHACHGKYWEMDTCKYQELIGERDTCIMETLERYTINKCNRLNSNKLRTECESYFINNSVKNKDLSLCGNNDLCIFHYAIENQDPEKCETLNEIQSKFTNLCFTYLSINLDMPEICKEENCFVFDYYTSKKHICNRKIISSAETAFCKTIKAIDSKNPSLCTGLTFNSIEQGKDFSVDATQICIISMALEYQDPSICEEIGPGSFFNSFDCKFYVTGDSSFCSQEKYSKNYVEGQDIKETCGYNNYCNIYNETYPVEICNKITSKSTKGKKYSYFLKFFFD